MVSLFLYSALLPRTITVLLVAHGAITSFDYLTRAVIIVLKYSIAHLEKCNLISQVMCRIYLSKLIIAFSTLYDKPLFL